MHSGLSGGSALFFLLPCEFDNQDRVFSGQANKYDETDLRQDVDRQPACEQAAYGCEETHRHDQNDRHRQLPTFVLRHEHEEHEESGCAEDNQRGSSVLLLLKGEIRPLEPDSLRKNLVGKLFHAEQRGTRGDTRSSYPLHLRGWKEIVARHTVWDGVVLQLCHGPNRHHFTGSVAYFQPRDVRLVASILTIGLDDHFVGSAQ